MIVPETAPDGSVTTRLPAVAVVTVAGAETTGLVPLNITVFRHHTGSKFVPVIVTVVPAVLTPVMFGRVKSVYGAMVMSDGVVPIPDKVVATESDVVSITETVPPPAFVTYTFFPFGVTSSPSGERNPLMVDVANDVPVVGMLITETVFPPWLLT